MDIPDFSGSASMYQQGVTDGKAQFQAKLSKQPELTDFIKKVERLLQSSAGSKTSIWVNSLRGGLQEACDIINHQKLRNFHLNRALEVAETFLRVHKGTVKILKQIEALKGETK